jgi:hypothetical protein
VRKFITQLDIYIFMTELDNYIFIMQLDTNLDQGEMYNVIKFVSDLRQVGGFLRVFRLFPSPIKLTATI